MTYLGESLLVKSFRHRADQAEAELPPASPGRAYFTGLATNLLNPKVGVFYVAAIPQFIPHGSVPVLMGLSLAGVHAALTIVWFALLILGGGAASRLLRSPQATRIIDRITGVVLVGFGVRLALEPR